MHGKILVGEKLVNLANCKLFAEIFLGNIHRYNESVLGMCNDFSLFAKIFLAKLYGLPNISPIKTFPCMVYN